MKILCLFSFIVILISCGDESSVVSEKPIVKGPLKIELYAQQFNWTAHYAGADNKFPKFDYKLVHPGNEIGITTQRTIDSSILDWKRQLAAFDEKMAILESESAPKWQVDKEIREHERAERILNLVIKMKQTHDSSFDKYAPDDFLITDTIYLLNKVSHELSFRSKDVIHSAYFPEFRVQMNTVPGTTTHTKFTPKVTTEEMRIEKNDPNFNYVLICNKICGKDHYKMKIPIKVVEKDEFRAWVKSNKKNLLKNN